MEQKRIFKSMALAATLSLVILTGCEQNGLK